MKRLQTTIYILMLMLPAFAGSKHHDHSGHNHDDHGHEQNKYHDDAKSITGPNGGRVFNEKGLIFEFFIMDDGRVKVSFIDEKSNIITPENQQISLIGGKRSDPIKLSFIRESDSFLSNSNLVNKGSIPIVLQIRLNANSKVKRIKFQLNLNNCSSCDYKEYVCICEH